VLPNRLKATVVDWLKRIPSALQSRILTGDYPHLRSV
jgi:hypothetical protein